MMLKVYLTEEGRIFIDRSAAYALGYISARALIIDDKKKFEISEKQLLQLKARDNLEIIYEKLPKEEIQEKPKIEVFINNLEYYITLSAAYSLGLISVETFNNMPNELYQISENLLEFLKNKYSVEYTEITEDNKKRR